MSKKEPELQHCDGDTSSSSSSSSASADEGDNNKSFVKKVKSRVSGLLPTTFSKWFGSKPRQRHELEADDGGEDETFTLQPPMKRLKKSAPPPVFDLAAAAAAAPSQQCNPFSVPIAGPSSSKGRQLLLPNTNYTAATVAAALAAAVEQQNGVDSDSGESTSGYSSMPHIGSKEQVSEMASGSNVPSAQHSAAVSPNKSIFNTTLTAERTLFGDKRFTSPNKANASLSSRRPSFNTSTFGTPNFMDKTLSTRRIINSPFYNGRITYGGASAYSQSIMATPPPPAEIVQPKTVGASRSNATTLSKTAKRILDTLEAYTSPVADVRRIPTVGRRMQQRDGLIAKYVGANPYLSSPKQPSNKELQVPTMTDMLKMKLKERLQDSTVSARTIASQATENARSYSLRNTDDDKASSGKSTNKIKTKVTSVRAQKATADDESVPVVHLPDVRLPISTLPSFNFALPFKSTTVEQSKPSIVVVEEDKKKNKEPVVVKIPEINFKAPENKPPPLPAAATTPMVKPTPAVNSLPAPPVSKDAKDCEFRFSKPLIIAKKNVKSLRAINNFKFSQPLVKKACNGVSETVGFGDAFKMSNKKWECSVCLVRNELSATSCVSCTTPKSPARTVNGSVSDKPPLWEQFKPSSSMWECAVCMIRNDASKTKCAACEAPRKSSSTAQPASNSISAASAAAASKFDFVGFKKTKDEWECDSCMVKNTNDKANCVCCEAPKPGASSKAPAPVTTIASSSSSSWGSKFKAPASTWECPICMIRNDVVKAQCAACESPRPASVVVPLAAGDAFKKKASEWECGSCMVRNANTTLKCVCCDAPKPGVPDAAPPSSKVEVPKFSFGIENGLINGHGFVFGIPADQNAKKEAPAKTSIDTTTTIATTQFTFGIQAPNGAKSPPSTVKKPVSDAPPAFTFGIPLAAKRKLADEEEVKAPLFQTLNGSTAAECAPPPPKFSFGVVAADKPAEVVTSSTTSAAAKPAESFGDNKASKPLFGSVSVAPVLNAVQSVVSSSTPSTFSFGSAAKPTPTATTSLFGSKSEANGLPDFKFANKETTATASSATVAPTFSFTPGSNSAKPTFGAGFGSSPSQPAVGITASNQTFGKSSASAPSLFSGVTAANNSSIFGSNAAPSTVAPSLQFGTSPATANSLPTFGTPTAAPPPPPAFGAAAAAATSNGPSVFGAKTAAPNGMFNFGASQPTENKPAFGFGSAAAPPSTGGFSFNAPAGTNGGFNFNAGSKAAGSVPVFNADVKATFNFSAGTPTTFTAQNQDLKAPTNRVIRRAVRRTQTR